MFVIVFLLFFGMDIPGAGSIRIFCRGRLIVVFVLCFGVGRLFIFYCSFFLCSLINSCGCFFLCFFCRAQADWEPGNPSPGRLICWFYRLICWFYFLLRPVWFLLSFFFYFLAGDIPGAVVRIVCRGRLIVVFVLCFGLLFAQVCWWFIVVFLAALINSCGCFFFRFFCQEQVVGFGGGVGSVTKR